MMSHVSLCNRNPSVLDGVQLWLVYYEYAHFTLVEASQHAVTTPLHNR